LIVFVDSYVFGDGDSLTHLIEYWHVDFWAMAVVVNVWSFAWLTIVTVCFAAFSTVQRQCFPFGFFTGSWLWAWNMFRLSCTDFKFVFVRTDTSVVIAA
jgi:hypothetical protein